jgi:hypothetical protein
MEKKEVRRRVRKAAQILLDRGLNRGYYEAHVGGKVCALGAIAYTFKGKRANYIAAAEVTQAIPDEPEIVWFNDKVAVNAREVASLLMGLAEEV